MALATHPPLVANLRNLASQSSALEGGAILQRQTRRIRNSLEVPTTLASITAAVPRSLAVGWPLLRSVVPRCHYDRRCQRVNDLISFVFLERSRQASNWMHSESSLRAC